MCQMLLSINPEHAENIINGTKRFEYRKVKCRKQVDKVIIYVTSPQKAIVGEAEIEEIIENDIGEVWRLTKDFAGISYNFFRAYYKGKKKAVAYRLRNVNVYDEPRQLADYGISWPPQSFAYIEQSHIYR